ncbi:MAG: right-handed parallel beta-helix repeat-containing protein [Candidatus Thorarchaeota archaeon]
MARRMSFLIAVSVCLLILTLLVGMVGSTELTSSLRRGHSDGIRDRNVDNKHLANAYIEHGPITIRSDADFEAQGWPGSGTAGDPYLIENLNITSTDTCITIRDTSACFIIRGCFLSSSSQHGIYLDNVTNGWIEDNIISNNGMRGMYLYLSSDNVLVNNTVCNNTQEGVFLYSSPHNVFVNNTISNNPGYGVFLGASSDCTLTGNNFETNSIALFGLSVTDWRQTITTNNTVDGEPVGYFWNLSGGEIDGSQYGQVILANCTDVTVRDGVFHNVSQMGFSEQCTLVNNTIFNNTGRGVYLCFSSSNMLTNNTISNNSGYGVVVSYSSNNTLINNAISNNSVAGVYFVSSSDNTLVSNVLGCNGIMMFGSSVTSWRQTITANNTVNGKAMGYFWNLSGGEIDGSQYGQVILANCTDVTVRDGVFHNVSERCTLLNNTISDNSGGGVSLYSSSGSTLINNTILYNLGTGVNLYSSHNNTLVNNTVSNNLPCGVNLDFSSNNTLINNTITNNPRSGVYLWYSPDSTLMDNTLENNGIVIYGSPVTCWRQTITANNTVNGKAMGYFWNLTGGEIDGSQYGQVILANCTDVTVRDGVFRNVSLGAQVGFSERCSLLNNIISNNSQSGVFLVCSSDCTLADNTISNNLCFGVDWDGSSGNAMTNNTVSNNGDDGVFLWFSCDNTLSNNTISNNSGDGLYVDSSSQNTLANNTVCDNGGAGVRMVSSSDRNDLLGNEVGLNSGTGIIIDGSSSNLLYRNRLYSNGGGNARDDGSDNHWNTTQVGNYWSDYGGTGGIYRIPGTAGSIDYHPRPTVDSDIPTIDHPADIKYAEATTGNQITWSPSDSCPDHYEVYRNSTVVESGVWNGGKITVTVDGLAAGTYNYTLVVYDEAGHSAADTVFVIVLADGDPPTIDHPTDIEYIEGTTGNVVTWSPSDAHPDRYEVYRNGTLVESGAWDGGQITVNVDGLGIGTYNYTLVVYDEVDHSAADTVFVVVVDGIAPTIDHPSDVEYVEGTTGNVITWSPSDAHPDRYEVYRNGTLVESGAWDGGQITVNVDGFGAGTYNYTLVVYDKAGNCASDTVLVTVMPVSSTTTTTTTGTTTVTTTTTTTGGTTETSTSAAPTTTSTGGGGTVMGMEVLLGGAAVVVVVIVLVAAARHK